MMRVIVAGSRSIDNEDAVQEAMDNAPFEITELVSGGANGVDQIAADIFSDTPTQLDESITVFEPDWDRHGKAAGPIRNEEMAIYADALIAVWDGESNGTKNMISTALEEGLDVYVRQVR